jgi:adenylosuccinate synthase
MKTIAVIGLGFGDEGKGMVTSSLAECYKNKNPVVIRYSGGQQAGHTVFYDGKSHVFSNFGSGTLQSVPTYWTELCTIDPLGVANELKVLVDKIDPYNIQLYVNKKCPVTTPYDKYRNQHDSDNIYHGTCGVGFGSTIQREEDGYHLYFEDLFNPTIEKIKLKAIATYSTEYYLTIGEYLEAVNTFTDPSYYPNEIIMPVDEIPDDFDTYIFEGSQGLLLDKDIGFFPHVTRANVGLKNIADMVQEVYYVTRAYQTRHGNGPMTHETKIDLRNNGIESNKIHEYQGKFRTGILDLDLLIYAINCDRKDSGSKKTVENLVITCMDQLKDFKFIKNRKIIKCKNASIFAKTIANTLGIKNNLYLSWNPNCGIEKFKI